MERSDRNLHEGPVPKLVPRNSGKERNTLAGIGDSAKIQPEHLPNTNQIELARWAGLWIIIDLSSLSL
jgi:hypothetical protein